MKLRAITLSNVRRFAGQRASVTGIGDGITVLSEPNEFGKTTFFDGLHALFFERHRATRASIKGLQPHSGGAPEVSVELSLPEGTFTISKRWLQGAFARVTRADGRLVATDDAAEEWINALLGGDLAGPSGLLWVRQGTMGLEPDGATTDDKRRREQAFAARRDIISSVAGEIEDMTGGRRMDAVLDRVAQDMAQIATPTGRPKGGGEWARAIEEVNTLDRDIADLSAKSDMLSGALTRRTDLARALSRLTDPQEKSARALRLAQAQNRHKAATDHQSRVTAARNALLLAQRERDRCADELNHCQKLSDAVLQAKAALALAEAASAQAQTDARQAGQLADDARRMLESAGESTRALRAEQTRALQARLARNALSTADDLHRKLGRAQELNASLQMDLASRRGMTVTDAKLHKLEAAQRALDLAQARAQALAVTVQAFPENGTPAVVDGAALPAGPVAVMRPIEIVLPGFGRLCVDPGTAQDHAHSQELAHALEQRDAALADCAVSTLNDAQEANAIARQLDARITQTRALLDEIAPDGLPALEQALAKARGQAAQAETDAPDPDQIAAALAQADTTEAEARARTQVAQENAQRARETRARAEADLSSARRAVDAALLQAGDTAELADRIVHLQSALPGLTQQVDTAQADLAALLAAAPDLETAEAALASAQGAVEQARRDESALREELAMLNERIATLAEEGVEERLAALHGARAAAQVRADRYEAEFRALQRLKAALLDARAQARDAYFAPVMQELRPLLATLHPDAELALDDATLLPAALTRNGQSENLDILSGGTREQIAILTRLAFARLFMRAGQSVPVILDDALVHSDDDRIEAMFTALHRVARDQQIIVLTCRQRAFAGLGGQRAQVRIDTL